MNSPLFLAKRRISQFRNLVRIPLLSLLLTIGGNAAPFDPNDPYFLPNVETGYYGQWHLENRMPVSEENAGYDINIRGAWARGLTGAGVIVGILDVGVEATHPDLEFHPGGGAKFLNAYSWGFHQTIAENLANPYRGDIPEEFIGYTRAHGTSSAGTVLATGGNGIGVTGGAPNASFASIQVDFFDDRDGYVPSQMMAAGLLYQGQMREGLPDPYAAVDWASFGSAGAPIRVKSMSLGGSYAFMETGAYGKSEIIADAVAEGTRHGVIYVVSAGNSRETLSSDDANKSFIISQPRVITVAALGSDAEFSNYSSYGANVFVTAPSSSYLDLYSISTTDNTGPEGFNTGLPEPYLTDDLAYTSRYGGTSAAAPIVSSVMALGVEANASMNARMAQHLLVRTSRVIDADDASESGGWVTNQAGNRFNSNYGFGLIDADAFTRMATEVTSLSEEIVYQTMPTTPPGQTFELGQPTLTFTQNMQETDPLPVEYVRVSLTITGLQADSDHYAGGIGSIAGDFSAVLVSAEGTRYNLFYDDSHLDLQDRAWQTVLTENEHDPRQPLDYLDWTFLSYAYWGESLNGDWTLELTNHGHLGTSLNGVWESVSFEFGTGQITVIPEPSTALLIGLSLGIGFWWKQRRKQKEARSWHLPSY